jgi:hypothetical protein
MGRKYRPQVEADFEEDKRGNWIKVERWCHLLKRMRREGEELTERLEVETGKKTRQKKG